MKLDVEETNIAQRPRLGGGIIKTITEISELRPPLQSYRKLFGSAMAKIGSALTKVVAPAIPTMTMATIMGLTPKQMVLLGAGSLATGIGLVLPDFVNFLEQKRVYTKNGLTFLLKFRDEHL